MKNLELSILFLVLSRDMDTENYFSTIKKKINPDYKWQFIFRFREQYREDWQTRNWYCLALAHCYAGM